MAITIDETAIVRRIRYSVDSRSAGRLTTVPQAAAATVPMSTAGMKWTRSW
jgi:hypothetical protein